VKRQVGIAMSQQQQSQLASVPNVKEANVSQRRSSCASTELPIDNVVETGQQRYPVAILWVISLNGHLVCCKVNTRA
jgi:hypothetical protein